MKRKHCCQRMTEAVNHKCEQHSSPFDCPDQLIYYSGRFDEYGIIIHDGGTSYNLIHFCPWCGTKLPPSKRNLWFEELELLGFDDPLEQDIPKEYVTDEWYKNKKKPSN
jgi:hypothetical protein